jgi:hypothetical protein
MRLRVQLRTQLNRREREGIELMLRRIAVVAVMAFVPLGVSAASASAESCSNEQLRRENNLTQLPDCRTYEQVSPVEKGSNANFTRNGAVSADGSAVLWSTLGIFADAPSGLLQEYISRRRDITWETHSLNQPPADVTNGAATLVVAALEPSFDRAILANQRNGESEVETFQRFNADAGVETLAAVPLGGFPNGMLASVAPSGDLQTIAFQTPSDLGVSPVSGSEQVYATSGGPIRLVSILPEGQPATEGATIGALPGGSAIHAVSEDGSRIIFNSSGELYDRIDALRTLQISASQTRPDPHGTQAKTFVGASADGSRIFFLSAEQLVAGADTNEDTTDELYEYQMNSAGTGGVLSVVSSGFGAGGSQALTLAGISTDGTSGFFTAGGVLASGGRGTIGMSNLYYFDPSGVRYVATLGASEAFNSRISDDGSHLIFLTATPLTSYDNRDANGTPRVEAYEYSVGDANPTCISCNPTGAPPTGDVQLIDTPGQDQSASVRAFNPSRNISDDGTRAFFESPDALVSGDSNGQMDVYEYEAGHVDLLSSGLSPFPSVFYGASADGNDVFIATSERLAPTDKDLLYDLYDVRVDGAVSVAEPPSVLCSGENCKPPATGPPVLSVPATGSVSGQGNVLSSAVKPTTTRRTTTRAQKLAGALAACGRKHRKAARALCRAQAERKYGPPHNVKSRVKKTNRRGR